MIMFVIDFPSWNISINNYELIRNVVYNKSMYASHYINKVIFFYLHSNQNCEVEKFLFTMECKDVTVYFE